MPGTYFFFKHSQKNNIEHIVTVNLKKIKIIRIPNDNPELTIETLTRMIDFNNLENDLETFNSRSWESTSY